MSDKFPLRFSEVVAYLLCIIVSTAMIWYLLIASYYYEDKPFIFFFLMAFVLMIAYCKIRLLIMLFPARVETCRICSFFSRKLEYQYL